MKNLEKRKGFKNRHIDKLPNKKVTIKIVINNFDGEHIILCEWNPFNKNEYSKHNIPTDNYVGTTKVIEKEFNGIGFHA